MNAGIIIAAIICGTVSLVAALNFVKWYIKHKAGATLGGQITSAFGTALKEFKADED